MSGRTITVTLPDVLYERVKSTAEASARSVEDVCTQSIALSLPELEDDLPSAIRSELAVLPFFLISSNTFSSTARRESCSVSKIGPLRALVRNGLFPLVCE